MQLASIAARTRRGPGAPSRANDGRVVLQTLHDDNGYVVGGAARERQIDQRLTRRLRPMAEGKLTDLALDHVAGETVAAENEDVVFLDLAVLDVELWPCADA